MALRPDVDLHKVNSTSYFINEVAERGCVVVLDSNNFNTFHNQRIMPVICARSPFNQTPVGILMNDVIHKNQSLNHHKWETYPDGKVTVCNKGWVVTDQIIGAPTKNSPAFLGPLGKFLTNVPSQEYVLVGEFLSTIDTLGFAKVYVHIKELAYENRIYIPICSIDRTKS